MIICGGSAVPRSLMENFEAKYGVRIVQAWGMTETSPLAASRTPRVVEVGSTEEMDWRARTGRVVGGVELRIVDDAGRSLPWDGEAVGEIEVRGPWITASYYRDPSPEEVRRRLAAHRRRRSVSPEGYIQITDRGEGRDQVGRRMDQLGRAREPLDGHPDVLEASVIGCPNPRWDERPLPAWCATADPRSMPPRSPRTWAST